MIIESQAVKSKSEEQSVLKKMKIGRAVIYQSIDKKGLQEILSSNQSSKNLTIVVIES